MLKKQSQKKIKGIFKKARIGIIQALYNEELTQNLTVKCFETLKAHGIKKAQIDIIKVPGSLEVPLVCQKLAESSKKYSALIALGVVIKGETHHFDIVVNETSRALMDVSLAYNIPIINEIIPAYNLKDAKVRASLDRHNKGIEAGRAALQMIIIMKK